MESADKMRRLFNSAAVQTNAAPDEALFEKVKTAYTQAVERRSAHQEPSMWRFLMKSPLAKLAVAAAVIIACGIGLFLWRGTGSGIALAEVLARVEKARSVRWDISFTMSGDAAPGRPSGWEERSTYLFSQDWGQRITRERTDPNGGQVPLAEIYTPLQEKTVIWVDHPSKTYTRTEMDETTFRRAREVMSRATAPATYVDAIIKCKYESLGRSTVDGVEVEGFHTTDPNIRWFLQFTDRQVDGKVWVDVKTRLPVCLERTGSGITKTGGRMSYHEVLDHIQWDLPLTGAEFEPPAVPSGYVIVADNLPGPITEEGTIQGLKQCVELLGKYPGNISVAPPEGIQSELDASDSPAAVRLKEELKGLPEQDRINRLMEVGTPLRCVQRFFVGLMDVMDDGRDPAYYGGTVTPQDADKVLLRWKVSDSEYRVIFGDLHAETVSPEKLAELEAALPK
jgi:hypothetical protein